VKLVLASASPRRKALLAQIGVRFDVNAVDICEDVLPNESPVPYVTRVALAKAEAGYALAKPQQVVLGADTSVILDGNIIGKPQNQADAVNMLMSLSGRTHQVITAVALVGSEQTHSFVVTTDVTFRALSREECELYWATGEPADKAGSYGIQGLGAIFVDHINGSYSSVVGLPLSETAELLKVADVEIWHTEEM